MSDRPSSFDHRPDPVLGDALRRALDAGDSRAFVARVLAAAPPRRAAAWDVLATWARRGIAAALLAALAAGWAVGRSLERPASLDEAITAADTLAQTALVTAPRPPDASAVFASFVQR